MDLCSVEIIEYVIGYLGNDIPTKMILFLKDDCNIDIQSKFLYYNKYNKAVCNVIYNGEIINSYISTQNSEAILVELFNIFIKEDKIKIKEKILEIREIKK